MAMTWRRARQVLRQIHESGADKKGGFLKYLQEDEKQEVLRLKETLPAYISTVETIRRIAMGRI